jgi:two-component system response regulator YesN
MYKVMVVDDMDIIHREFRRMPIWGSMSGFEISAEAKNGQEALELLKSGDTDLVITDIKMPKIDGLELLQKINERNLSRCVVLMSDYTDFSFARQGLVLGAFDYLVKPVAANELTNLLQRVTEYLEEKNREAERLKKLEEKLDEKVTALFPDADVDQLIELIITGDPRASDLADRIAGFFAASTENDLIRMEFLLKNVLSVIVRSVLEKKKWLCGFTDQNMIADTDGLRCDTITEMKDIFINKLESLQNLIIKLECVRTDSEIVNRMCSCVLESIDCEVSLKSVSERLFMNRTYLSEVFRQKTGIQFVEYLTMIKMERAKILLVERRLKTYEIAEKLGFKDIEYFSRLFKKFTGIPPAEYRQTNTI